MFFYNQLVLNISSNLKSYKLTIIAPDGKYSGIINKKNTCICLYTCGKYLKIIATPLSEGFTTSIIKEINTDCPINNLSLRFVNRRRTTPITPLFSFTLTDKNYGMGVNGILRFENG